MNEDFRISRIAIKSIDVGVLKKSKEHIFLFYVLCESSDVVTEDEIVDIIEEIEGGTITWEGAKKRIDRINDALDIYYSSEKVKECGYKLQLKKEPFEDRNLIEVSKDTKGWGAFVITGKKNTFLKKLFKKDEKPLIDLEALKEKKKDSQILEEAEIELPKTPEDLIKAGDYYYFIGEYEKALYVFKKSQSIDPTSDHTRYGIAICLDEMGRHEEAIKSLSTILFLRQDDLEDVKRRLDESSGKDKYFKEYYKFYKSVLIGKARALYNLKRYEQALMIVNKMAEIEPQDKNLLSMKALFLIRERRIKEANEIIKKVLKDKRNMEIDFWYNIGACFSILKEKEKFIESLETIFFIIDFNYHNKLFENKMKRKIIKDPDYGLLKDSDTYQMIKRSYLIRNRIYHE